MLVFISGMFRSASTYSYNVARQALMARGPTVGVSLADTPEILSHATGTHLINKAHRADDMMISLVRIGAAKSICTVRRPERAVLSWMHTFGFSVSEAIAQFEEWFALYEQIAPLSLVVDMEAIENRPFRATLKIGRHLFADYGLLEAASAARTFSKRRVEKIASEVASGQRRSVDIGFSKYDPETFFHRRHISDRDSMTDDPATINEVRKRLGRWIDADGRLHPLARLERDSYTVPGRAIASHQ